MKAITMERNCEKIYSYLADGVIVTVVYHILARSHAVAVLVVVLVGMLVVPIGWTQSRH